jgi:hypothetical protein
MGDSGVAGVKGSASTPRPPGSIVTSDPRAGANTQALARVQAHIPRSVDILGAARVAARIQRGAHIREAAVGNRLPHSANTYGHTDRDGNPADKDTARMKHTRSALAR